MDAKEKAKELVEAMTFSCRECDYDAKAKQSALIANQEALDVAFMLNNQVLTTYYLEVKEEIEKL